MIEKEDLRETRRYITLVWKLLSKCKLIAAGSNYDCTIKTITPHSSFLFYRKNSCKNQCWIRLTSVNLGIARSSCCITKGALYLWKNIITSACARFRVFYIFKCRRKMHLQFLLFNNDPIFIIMMFWQFSIELVGFVNLKKES